MISNILRNKVWELVENQINIEELEEWLVPQLPLYISDPNSGDADLVSAIELGMSELTNGIRPYKDFIKYLRQVLQEKTVLLIEFPNNSASSTSQTNHVHDLTMGQAAVRWSQP